MKICSKQIDKGFTLTEALVVIIVLVALAIFLLPKKNNTRAAPLLVQCNANLRQMEDAFNEFTIDHDGKFPMQVSITNGGSMQLIVKGNLVSTFQLLSNYLVSPKMLVCPADNRSKAQNFSLLQGKNISYFVSLDASPLISRVIVAGDRNLSVSGEPVKASLLTLTTNVLISWSANMHSRRHHKPCGNILFSDGPDTVWDNLTSAISSQNIGTNRIAIP